MYYQWQYPDVEFSVCPAVTQGIDRLNWHLGEHGISAVMGELARCGNQFAGILNEMRMAESGAAASGGSQEWEEKGWNSSAFV
jgi:hypothetical protein